MRFGVIGTNYISDEFIRCARLVEGVEVCACFSRDINKGKEYSVKHNIPFSYDNHFEMINSNNIDTVYIATPNSTHHDIAKIYLENKIPVLLEKPFTLNYKEASELFDISKKYNTYIADAIVPIYTDNFKKIKDIIDKIGKINKVNLIYPQDSIMYKMYKEGIILNTFKKEYGNGSLMALGVYLIAIMILLFGKPKTIKAISKFMETGVDLSTDMLFEYDDFIVNASSGRGVISQSHSEILGEKGYIGFDDPNRLENVWLYEKENDIKTSFNNKYPSMCYEIIDFKNNIEKGNNESSLLPHSLSLNIMEVLDEVRKEINLEY